MISSYPSIYALGHRYLADLFTGPIIIEEKIDGSQFSFHYDNGAPTCRSKGQEIHIGAPEKMFSKAVETVLSIQDRLHPGWTYRGEYLQKPKHNCLAYGRVPAGNIIIFDVMVGGENYLSQEAKRAEAERLGLECVPTIYAGPGEELVSDWPGILNRDSILGSVKIEGVVVKNYGKFGIDKKILIGKFVSPEFKEKHGGEWRKANPTKSDVEQHLITQLTSEARWRKAVQHLREAGKITDTPVDIGPLLQEIKADVEKEETDHIKEALFKHFWPKIARGITAGFPVWYKKELGILIETRLEECLTRDGEIWASDLDDQCRPL